MKQLLKLSRFELCSVVVDGRTVEISNSAVVPDTGGSPHVLVLGGVHGNEWCGVRAIDRFLEEVKEGKWSWKGGRLAFVLGNEEALEARVRYIGANMNRQFSDRFPPQGSDYERERVKVLKACLASGFDYVLDLHSTSAPTVPYVMCEKPHLTEAKAFGFRNIVVGWGALGDQSLAGDTETYAIQHGAKAFTLENGQHDESSTETNAYEALVQFLNRLGLSPLINPQHGPQRVFELMAVQRLEDRSFEYARPFKNLEPLKPGEIIGQDRFKQYAAPDDFEPWMVLPGPPQHTKVGDNLYLIARKIDRE